MRRFLVIAVLSLMGFVHCGGEATTEAQAQGIQDAGGVASEEPAALIHDPVTGGTVAANAGFAANGTILTIPTGFTSAQCRFTASLATLDGKATSAQVGINETTGEVVCKKVVQERVEIPPEIKDCTASFTIICVK